MQRFLAAQPIGAFLIRVSTRIFGYTLSFVDKERFKVSNAILYLFKAHVLSSQHFLIDYTDGKYTVVGGTESRYTSHVMS